MLMGHIDHQFIGYRLAKKWEMDDRASQVIGGHHGVQGHDPNLAKASGPDRRSRRDHLPLPGHRHPEPALPYL